MSFLYYFFNEYQDVQLIDQECPVCYEQIYNIDVLQPCNHLVHIECVEKHYPVIIESMNKSNKEEKIRKKKKKTTISYKSDEDSKSKSSIKTKVIKQAETPSFIVEFD